MTGSLGGILYPASLPTFTRLPPPAQIGDFVEWFWIPEWDMPHGRTSRQEVIAYPASNLVVESNRVTLSGPSTVRTHRDLTGSGWAVGALLRAAAVPAFVEDPEELRDDSRELDLPELRAGVDRAMRISNPERRRAEAVAVMAAWLEQRIPAATDEALLANRMVALLGGDDSVLRIEDAARHLGVSARTLQRLAKRYVGVPPAALIRRRRLQEAALRLRTEREADLAAVAADLGYADQSHLTKDFRRVLGFTPASYRRSQP